MIDALGTATQGAHNALQSFDQAAAQLAKAGTNAVDQVTSNGAAPPAPNDGIVKAVVQMSQAETNYSANAKVIETVDRLMGETLDILA